jgi:hypothetical protein
VPPFLDRFRARAAAVDSLPAHDGGVVLVCHNVDNPNWGCRGTSLALHQRLSGDGQQLATVSRGTSANPVLRAIPMARPPVAAMAEGWALGRIALGRGARAVRFADVVADDPRRSIARLEAAARWHPTVAALLSSVRAARAVVVNGEGSMILRDPARRDLLFQLAIVAYAQRAGVPVSYVNAIASPCPETGVSSRLLDTCLDVLAGCAAVQVRDPRSLRFLVDSGYHGSNLSLVPDALFTWALDRPEALARPVSLAAIETNPERASMFGPGIDLARGYVCVSGASVPLRADRRAWVQPFVELVEGLRVALGLPVILVEPCEGDRFLHEVARRTASPVVRVESNVISGCGLLANATAYVSGRYHPSIMASLGGTPLVGFVSNSHKIVGLRDLLELPDEDVQHPGAPGFARMTTKATLRALAGHDRAALAARALSAGMDAHHALDGLVTGAPAEARL